jgi:pyruvate-ferredoxin/flavodoxin oxidoreductase
MAMTYGYVYVASVSMGANMNQVIKAFKEAEAYKGPSLVICYAPCINQGIRKGMGKSMEEGKLAVETGYWPLYRFNPDLAAQGENPFKFESKAPNGKLQEFLSGENRYALLEKMAPEESKRLRTLIEKEYEERFLHFKTISELPGINVAPAAATVKAGKDAGEFCTTTETPEHAKLEAGAPCDDGRGAK